MYVSLVYACLVSVCKVCMFGVCMTGVYVCVCSVFVRGVSVSLVCVCVSAVSVCVYIGGGGSHSAHLPFHSLTAPLPVSFCVPIPVQRTSVEWVRQ